MIPPYILNQITTLAQQAGQSIQQWIQSPSGQHFLKHLGYHISREISEWVKKNF